MRLKIPLTGKILEYTPEFEGYGPSGEISGDPANPVRPVPINLGNVKWNLVSIDLETDTAEIEVSPGEGINGRLATDEEKQGFLDYAKNLVEEHTIDELYAMTNSKRLEKSSGIMVEWRKKHYSKGR